MTQTIIKRVEDALRASGNAALADELKEFIVSFAGNVSNLLKLQNKSQHTIREYIEVVQRRCSHVEWRLGSTNIESDPSTWGPEGWMSCVGCGYTLCNQKAWEYGNRARLNHSMNYNHDRGTFSMIGSLRLNVIEQIQKEMTDADNAEATLRTTGDDAAPVEAADHGVRQSAGSESGG